MSRRLTRRFFLGGSLAAGGVISSARGAIVGDDRQTLDHRVDDVAAAAVLRVDGLDKPVKIASMELLRNRRNFLVRVRTTDGAEGIGVPNAMHMIHTYPIFLNRVAPFFVGKDARQLEPLLWELYRHDDNYKYQGLALWVCVGGRRVRDPRPARQADRASRSATCWAASSGARSRSTGPAATGATRPRRRSRISSRSSPRPARRRSSSASAAA